MSESRPCAAQYVVTFLKPEMLHVYRQIQGLKGFRPMVFCQRRENAAQFPFSEIRVLGKHWAHQIRRFWCRKITKKPIQLFPSEAKRLTTALAAVDAQVLHIFFGHMGVQLLPWLRMRRIAAVLSFHGADVAPGKEERRSLREAFDLVDLVLVRSESLGRGLVALGCPSEKIRIHRTGIPLADFPVPPLRPRPPDGCWQFVQACRLIPKKGLETSLRAFAEFYSAHPHARLTIAGEGPLLAALRALALELGIAEAVEFMGFLSQPDLRSVFARSHVFLHPSNTPASGDQEGVPNAMLEAMAAGLPVIATPHGGIPEAIQTEIHGLLVPENDPAAVTGAMLRLAADDGLRGRIAAAGRDRVIAVFDLACQTKVLETYYAEAMTVFQERAIRLGAG